MMLVGGEVEAGGVDIWKGFWYIDLKVSDLCFA